MARGRKRAWPPPIRTRRGKEYIRVTQDGERKWISLGPAGSAEAREKYTSVLAEIAACQGRLPVKGGGLTVREAGNEYVARSQQEDVRTLHRRRRAIEGAVALYGATLLAEFGPLKLRAIRRRWEEEGLGRRYVNHLTRAVKSWIAWCVEEELLRAEVAWALWQVAGLRRGKTEAQDQPKVRPVDRSLLEQTLPHLPAIVADMVRLQSWTGMRPGEVCRMKGCDVLRPWKKIDGVEMWLYQLDGHKTEWSGHLRWAPLGPRAQALLLPYLQSRAAGDFLFSPAESRRLWEEGRRLARRTPLSCGNRPGSNRAANPKRRPGARYTTQSYGEAVERGCLRGLLPHWTPNQLRHLVGTEVETEYDREAARCVLGHSSPQVTAVYAESVEKAARVLAKRG